MRATDDQLIAVGQAGTILVSANAFDWQKRSSGVTEWLNDISRVNGAYFVVGANGTVLKSADTESWKSIGAITPLSLYSAVQHDGQLLVVGLEGIILRKQIVPRTNPILIQFSQSVSPQGVYTNHFGFSGFTGQRFTLDRSDNLEDWIPGPKFELLDSSGILEYFDTTEKRQEFYRTRLEE